MTWELAGYVLAGIPITILVTVGAIAIGSVVAVPILLARISRWKSLRAAAAGLIALVRSIPPILWVFIAYFGIADVFFQMSPILSAIVVFGLIAAVNMAEIYRSGILAIPAGQWEAATALNFSATTTFVSVILPQMIRVSQPSAVTYLIGLTKDTAIASTIGVAEVAFRGNFAAQKSFDGITAYALVGLIYILLSIPLAWVSRTVDTHLQARIAR